MEHCPINTTFPKLFCDLVTLYGEKAYKAAANSSKRPTNVNLSLKIIFNKNPSDRIGSKNAIGIERLKKTLSGHVKKSTIHSQHAQHNKEPTFSLHGQTTKPYSSAFPTLLYRNMAFGNQGIFSFW